MMKAAWVDLGMLSLFLVATACAEQQAPRSPQPTLAPAAAPDDRYDALVAQAEAGEPISFRELRTAYLASPAYRPDSEDPKKLLTRLDEATSERHPDNAAIFALTNEILKTWYVNPDAHQWR